MRYPFFAGETDMLSISFLWDSTALTLRWRKLKAARLSSYRLVTFYHKEYQYAIS